MRLVSFVIIITLVLLAIGIYIFIYHPEVMSRFISSKINIMTISSPSFENNRFIPSAYTCDGNNINPSFKISEVPKKAQSLALIMEDLDAIFTHWTIWNIDPRTKEIAQQDLLQGAAEGLNSFGNRGYQGPCPPAGVHRYSFTLYALDAVLDLPDGSTPAQFRQAISGHILTQAAIIGQYGRIK